MIPRFLVFVLAALPVCAGESGPPPSDSSSTNSRALWESYVAHPNTHPNIPNCSYAGYRAGDAPLPTPPVVARVEDFGAKPDDDLDDAPAFRAALAAAERAGGGAVSVGEGRFAIDGLLHLSQSRVVLRGAGIEKTQLEFRRPLKEIAGEFPDGNNSAWSFSGGLVWLGPADMFDANGRFIPPPKGAHVQSWEDWRLGEPVAVLVQGARRGATAVDAARAGTVEPGEWLVAAWRNPADASLVRHVYGHAPTAGEIPGAAVGTTAWLLPPITERVLWPVQVRAESGNRIELAQPLRLDVGEWGVRLHRLGPVVRESGVESLTIVAHAAPTHRHLQCLGWNGVYLNRAIDCWVRDVRIENAENGVILAAAKQCTVTNVRIAGPAVQHHPFACRVFSHDNLFEHFVIDGPTTVQHGINMEWFSSGNVWRRGVMRNGTFDSHRALPFDALFTDITVANDSGAAPGGSGLAGPRMGARVVRWNVRVAYDGHGGHRPAGGRTVAQPRLLPHGAIVGLQGAEIVSDEASAMPPGEKAAIVADIGHAPEPTDLYLAQKALRRANNR